MVSLVDRFHPFSCTYEIWCIVVVFPFDVNLPGKIMRYHTQRLYPSTKNGPDKTTIIMSDMAWQSWTFFFPCDAFILFCFFIFALFFFFLFFLRVIGELLPVDWRGVRNLGPYGVVISFVILYFRFWNCSKALSYLSWTGYPCWFEYR